MFIYEPGKTMDQYEREIISAAYAYHEGNKTKVAAALGLAIRTIDSKVAKYELSKDKNESTDKGTATDNSGKRDSGKGREGDH